MKQTDPKEIEAYFNKLWPICRSITGNGLRESFQILSDLIPLTLTEVPTGTPVFDWVIPNEWNISDAYIITPEGKKICDFKTNNLHVVNYSIPVNKELSYDELVKHLYTLERLPDAIPYVTSYYKEKWGFCLSKNEFDKLPKTGTYKVMIDAELKPGALTYGEYILKGETEEEILFSSYLCHPSMANNELSGPLVLSFLYRLIAAMPKRRYTYRFVIAPETIGTIAFLANNKEEVLKNVKAGYVLTCCGTDKPVVFKRSRQEHSTADNMALHVLKHSGKIYSVIGFDPLGSDERQYCSPGFNLPVASLMRSKYHDYPEYHTSLDNKELISFEAMSETIELYFSIVKALELNGYYKNTIQFCEPNMGKRGLYEDLSGALTMPQQLSTRMRLINYMDGKTSLLEFCERYDLNILDLKNEIDLLIQKGVLAD
jgi:aminopeptidase-like protein